MRELTVREEPFTSSGALSIYYAAIDELTRRYHSGDDEFRIEATELQPPRGFFVVARRDSHPVGGVGVRSIVDPALALGEVKRLWVRPDQRRLGVADALLSFVHQRACQLGYRELYLETGDAQPEAQALYKKTGWRPVTDFPDGAFSYPTAVRFAKTL